MKINGTLVVSALCPVPIPLLDMAGYWEDSLHHQQQHENMENFNNRDMRHIYLNTTQSWTPTNGWLPLCLYPPVSEVLGPCKGHCDQSSSELGGLHILTLMWFRKFYTRHVCRNCLSKLSLFTPQVSLLELELGRIGSWVIVLLMIIPSINCLTSERTLKTIT